MLRNVCSVLLFVVMVSSSQVLHAWGGVGHHDICQVATSLVESPDLKEFLRSRQHMMGHLCNIPDVYWKSLDFAKDGNFGHYINPEWIKKTPETFPQKVSEAEELTKAMFPEETSWYKKTGALWFRAQQFFNRALAEAKKAKTALPPEPKDFQNDSYAYNEAVYSMMTNMGLMGHFFGDASMPFHNTADHDGYETGHGGIHSFYEEEAMACLGVDFNKEIMAEARALLSKKLKHKNWSDDEYAVQSVRQISVESIKEKAQIEKLDRVLKPSTPGEKKPGAAVISKGEKAQRVEACDASKSFKRLIVTEMARSAVALAAAWNEIYVRASEPKLKNYKSFRYPLSPSYVEMDFTSVTK